MGQGVCSSHAMLFLAVLTINTSNLQSFRAAVRMAYLARVRGGWRSLDANTIAEGLFILGETGKRGTQARWVKQILSWTKARVEEMSFVALKWVGGVREKIRNCAQPNNPACIQ